MKSFEKKTRSWFGINEIEKNDITNFKTKPLGCNF